MNNILAVLTDLDGTVIFPDGSFSAATRSSIEDLVQRGVFVVPVTGRSYRSYGQTCKDLGLLGLGVFNGGAIIVNFSNDEILWERPLQNDTAISLLLEIAPFCNYLSFGYGHQSVKELNIPKQDFKCFSIWAELPPRDVQEVMKIIDSYKDLAARANMVLVDDRVGIQINHREANKLFGALKVLDLLKIDALEALAIGDDNNDIPFFRAVGTRVAMENASPELIALADYVTTSIQQEGFTEAMKKYFKKS